VIFQFFLALEKLAAQSVISAPKYFILVSFPCVTSQKVDHQETFSGTEHALEAVKF